MDARQDSYCESRELNSCSSPSSSTCASRWRSASSPSPPHMGRARDERARGAPRRSVPGRHPHHGATRCAVERPTGRWGGFGGRLAARAWCVVACGAAGCSWRRAGAASRAAGCCRRGWWRVWVSSQLLIDSGLRVLSGSQLLGSQGYHRPVGSWLLPERDPGLHEAAGCCRMGVVRGAATRRTGSMGVARVHSRRGERRAADGGRVCGAAARRVTAFCDYALGALANSTC